MLTMPCPPKPSFDTPSVIGAEEFLRLSVTPHPVCWVVVVVRMDRGVGVGPCE